MTVRKSLHRSSGRNLPVKEFCYLGTVNLTAAMCLQEISAVLKMNARKPFYQAIASSFICSAREERIRMSCNAIKIMFPVPFQVSESDGNSGYKIRFMVYKF